MEQMEEGKENSAEDVNIENVDNIICHEELQPEVINTEIDQSIEYICTIQDSKEVLCQGILMDILENIFKQPFDPDLEVVTCNHQNINHNDILQMNVEEIILGQVPIMQENIVQDIVKDKPSALTSQSLQKMTQKFKGKHLDISLLNVY